MFRIHHQHSTSAGRIPGGGRGLAGGTLAEPVLRGCTASRSTYALAIAFCLMGFTTVSVQAESEFAGLIRTKKPDRPSYQAPVVDNSNDVELAEEETLAADETVNDGDDPSVTDAQIVRGGVRQVAHAETFDPIQPIESPRILRTQATYLEPACGIEASCGVEASCGIEASCGCEAAGYACDGSCMSCDSGCDGMFTYGDACGCNACGGYNGFLFGGAPARLSLDPCQWFGSVELLLMWRNGDGLPVLATTRQGTQTVTLFGGERVLDELTAGGRVTLGTWLDDQQCRSLVFRGWGAEQASYGFGSDQTRNATILRPFRDVTPPATGTANNLEVAVPNRFNGSLDISGTSNVYGGDVSLRQRWLSGFGGAIDLLYGYQYMHMDEDLNISSSSTFIGTAPPDPGTMIAVVDQFDADNEFHGGQLGLAARYREGCWSFNGSIKAAAGALKRTATRRGRDSRTVAGVTDTDPTGLLVQSTNSGTFSDSTFGWVPELDATLGWHWTRDLDLTFGYHVIAMTDALQVSGTIDPTLTVNTANNGTGQQRPSPSMRYDTFYIHGIHFGVQCRF